MVDKIKEFAKKIKQFLRKLRQDTPTFILFIVFSAVILINVAFIIYGAVVLSLLLTGEILPKPLFAYLCLPVVVANGIFIIYLTTYLILRRK